MAGNLLTARALRIGVSTLLEHLDGRSDAGDLHEWRSIASDLLEQLQRFWSETTEQFVLSYARFEANDVGGGAERMNDIVLVMRRLGINVMPQ